MTAAPQLPLASKKPYIDSFEHDPVYMRKCVGARWLQVRIYGRDGFEGRDAMKQIFLDAYNSGGVTEEKRKHKFSIGETNNHVEGMFGPLRPQYNLPFLFPKLWWWYNKTKKEDLA